MPAKSSRNLQLKPRIVPPAPSWQAQMADAITNPAELIELLQLPQSLLGPAQQATRLFPLRAPRCFVDRIKPANPDDPLLRQILPLHLELTDTPGYTIDPLLEQQAMPATGLLHKYPGRVLLVTTGACAIHCRYCFRRHFPYSEASATRQSWSESLAYVQNDKQISEVILSGGDPLTLSDAKLAELVMRLESIPHVKTLRLHTRLPIVLPDRFTDELFEVISHARLNVVFVIHSNHANEIDDAVADVMKRISATGATILNQAVLLRGVNDTLADQIDLHEKLFQIGVLPYYLHLPDKVLGTAHFDTDESTAVKLVHAMRDSMPGYLVPRLVREIPGDQAKRIIA